MLPYGGKAGNDIIWQFYEQYAKEDFKGYKVLVVHGDGGMNLHTRGKAVHTLADLKGLKLRASSRTAAKTVESLGATPVSMPPAQMTEAISKGVVDGALAAWEVVPATKLDEVTQYHSVTPAGQPALGYTVLAMLMNQKNSTACRPTCRRSSNATAARCCPSASPPPGTRPPMPPMTPPRPRAW